MRKYWRKEMDRDRKYEEQKKYLEDHERKKEEKREQAYNRRMKEKYGEENYLKEIEKDGGYNKKIHIAKQEKEHEEMWPYHNYDPPLKK